MLKLVRCDLSSECWETVVDSLTPVASGITLWQVREIDPKTNRKAFYRGQEYVVHSPGVVLEIVTDESWMDDLLKKIARAREQGLIGGRDVQVFSVEESYRIRDGFMDG